LFRVTFFLDEKVRLWIDLAASGNNVLTILKGHTDLVYAAKFNDNGSRLVTCSLDKTARIWRVGPSQPRGIISALNGHTNLIWSVHFNEQEDKVVTASLDGTARIWEVETGNVIHILAGHSDAVTLAQFSPRQDTVLTSSSDGTIRIWDVETGNLVYTHQKGGGADINNMLKFLYDGNNKWIGTFRPREGTHNTFLQLFSRKADPKAVKGSTLDILLQNKHFLEEDITIAQVAILYDILAIQWSKDFEEQEAGLTFDFNQYPAFLWNSYLSLPEVFRKIFDPWVIKPIL
jgi:hypothetical protein